MSIRLSVKFLIHQSPHEAPKNTLLPPYLQNQNKDRWFKILYAFKQIDLITSIHLKKRTLLYVV